MRSLEITVDNGLVAPSEKDFRNFLSEIPSESESLRNFRRKRLISDRFRKENSDQIFRNRNRKSEKNKNFAKFSEMVLNLANAMQS